MFPLVKASSQLEKKLSSIALLFIQKKQTLAVAESCTGGLLSYFLTVISGSSKFFLGSVVSYSRLVKTQYLGIPDSLLNQQGAVNKTICRLMAQNIKKQWKSDWAVSVTGVAGPEKKDIDPPVGTVFIGLLGPSCDLVEQILLPNKNRQSVQYQSSVFALDFLYSYLKMGKINNNIGGK